MNGRRSKRGTWSESTGEGEDVLLLIHGMGANGAVWDPFLETAATNWKGKIVVPDLRGHGRSEHRDNYSFGTMASDLAELIQPGESVSIIGHSLGGALGAFLATGWFGVEVACVLALSVKVKWSPDEIQKGRSLAQTPVRWMATREEALERYLRASGLTALGAQVARSAEVGIVEDGGRYRLAIDNRSFGSAALGVPALLGQSRAPLILVTGESDPIARPGDFADEGLEVLTIQGAGHQLPVEVPEAVWRAFEALRERTVASAAA